MLKIEIPVKEPSVWVTIARLRNNNLDDLAPFMKARVLNLLEDCSKVETVNGEAFDPIVFETVRSDKLQQIYFSQGTTKAKTAIYGWHFYGLAIDVISRSKEWSVSAGWWDTLSELMIANGLTSGHNWTMKDHPHGQFGGVKASPSDASRELYFGTTNWRGLSVYSDQKHEEGLKRVWKAVGAM